MGKLDGKVAIVTGGGRGIGRAIAEAYLQEGASVTITAAQGQAELDQFVKQDRSEGVLAMLADVTNQEACEQIVDKTIQRFGHVDILVNNAGRGMKYVSPSFLTEPTRFWEVTPPTWRMIIETNVNGPFYYGPCHRSAHVSKPPDSRLTYQHSSFFWPGETISCSERFFAKPDRSRRQAQTRQTRHSCTARPAGREQMLEQSLLW